MRIIAFLILLSLPVIAAPKKVRIGLISGKTLEMQSKANAFAKALSSDLHLRVEIKIAKDYPSLVSAMRAKELDFAFFNTMSFAVAEKETQAKVLLKVAEEKSYYFSSIVVARESKMNSLEDLRGKTIVFVDPQSTSGFLYPHNALQEHKIDLKNDLKSYYFSGNHKNSIQDVLSGKADAAAVFASNEKASMGAWSSLFHPAKEVKVLWLSQAIPTDPFCVRQDFYNANPDLSHKVMLQLLEMSEKKDNPLLKLLKIRKMVIANSSQYEPVRQIAQNLKRIDY